MKVILDKEPTPRKARCFGDPNKTTAAELEKFERFKAQAKAYDELDHKGAITEEAVIIDRLQMYLMYMENLALYGLWVEDDRYADNDCSREAIEAQTLYGFMCPEAVIWCLDMYHLWNDKLKEVLERDGIKLYKCNHLDEYDMPKWEESEDED